MLRPWVLWVSQHVYLPGQSLAWSQQGFCQPSFCKNIIYKAFDLIGGNWVMLHSIAFLEQRKCEEKLRMMQNGHIFIVVFSPMKAMQRNAPKFSHHNKGFINYVFCRNWDVRNPAGTRLDSSLVNKQVAASQNKTKIIRK